MHYRVRWVEAVSGYFNYQLNNFGVGEVTNTQVGLEGRTRILVFGDSHTAGGS